jgi:hypothetical protein
VGAALEEADGVGRQRSLAAVNPSLLLLCGWFFGAKIPSLDAVDEEVREGREKCASVVLVVKLVLLWLWCVFCEVQCCGSKLVDLGWIQRS